MIRLAALLALLCTAAQAQPSMEPLGPSILDSGSAEVNVHDFDLPAPAGAAHRIGVLVPDGPAPEGGFPVVFLLDGGAVLDRLTDARLAALPQGNPAVIVTLGHRTDQRYATTERARDYTPPSSDGGPVEDPRGRPGGGAADFLALISEAVLPRVARIAPIDLSQSTLWGHSYGGLFVLYAASRPEAPFAHYVSASPSLWWDHADFLTRITAQIEAGTWPDRRLDLHHGGQERERASNPANPNAQKLVQMRAALPPDALRGLDAALRAAGIPGALTIFPGLSHGESFGASVDATLNASFFATEDR